MGKLFTPENLAKEKRLMGLCSLFYRAGKPLEKQARFWQREIDKEVLVDPERSIFRAKPRWDEKRVAELEARRDDLNRKADILLNMAKKYDRQVLRVYA